MILISDRLRPELRSAAFVDLERAGCAGLRTEEERERFYVITTLDCPCRCNFCLFIKTADERPMCSAEKLGERVDAVLAAFPETGFSISITGGEPLMYPERVVAVLNSIRRRATPGRIRWIGFGTSGVTKPPTYLNEYPEFRFDVHMSRHAIEPEAQRRVFVQGKPRTVREYRDALGDHVSVRLTCNLIRHEIDSLAQVKGYLAYAAREGARFGS